MNSVVEHIVCTKRFSVLEYTRFYFLFYLSSSRVLCVFIKLSSLHFVATWRGQFVLHSTCIFTFT